MFWLKVRQVLSCWTMHCAPIIDDQKECGPPKDDDQSSIIEGNSRRTRVLWHLSTLRTLLREVANCLRNISLVLFSTHSVLKCSSWNLLYYVQNTQNSSIQTDHQNSRPLGPPTPTLHGDIFSRGSIQYNGWLFDHHTYIWASPIKA